MWLPLQRHSPTDNTQTAGLLCKMKIQVYYTDWADGPCVTHTGRSCFMPGLCFWRTTSKSNTKFPFKTVYLYNLRVPELKTSSYIAQWQPVSAKSALIQSALSRIAGMQLWAYSTCQQFVRLFQVDLACLISLQYWLAFTNSSLRLHQVTHTYISHSCCKKNQYWWRKCMS